MRLDRPFVAAAGAVAVLSALLGALPTRLRFGIEAAAFRCAGGAKIRVWSDEATLPGVIGAPRFSTFVHTRSSLVNGAMTLSAAAAASNADDVTLTTTEPMQRIAGVRELVDRYDIYLLDMWGVLHDGTTTYPGVLDCIQQLRFYNKTLIILSNSSKRQEHTIASLRQLGFDPNDFANIVTSGEVAFHMLSGTFGYNQLWSTLETLRTTSQRRVVLMGSGDGDLEYIVQAGWQLAPSVDQADLMVARGTFTVMYGATTIEKATDELAYENALQQVLRVAAHQQLPLLITNPDKIRPDSDRAPMPGKIGVQYAACLSETKVGPQDGLIYHVGKPFGDVYQLAFANGDHNNKTLSRVCMVGDALETDMVGGSVAGVDTVWVLETGIHRDDITNVDSIPHVLENFNARGSNETYAQGQQVAPTYVVPSFRW